MAKHVKTWFITFNNGLKCPLLGFGTYRAKENEAYQAVKKALEVGYRHIDTAFTYENEKEVGKAVNDKIKKGLFKREDVFMVSKLSTTNHRRHMVVPALRKTLENLNMEYLDLFLIHAPWSTKPLKDGEIRVNCQVDEDGNPLFDDIDPVETWKGMEECVNLGLARSIGLSNFNSRQTLDILKNCSIKPVTNQVECHHLFSQEKLFNFSKDHSITLSAFRSLGGEKKIHIILGDANIKNLAEKYKKSPAQVIIRWHLQRNIITLPKSSNPKRIKENFDVFDFAISDEDMKFISSLDRNERFVEFLDGKGSKYFPYPDDVEF